MFEKPLFGATISPSCEYCEFGRKAPQPGCFTVRKKGPVRQMSKCRHYRYDPLRRVPKRAPKLPSFSRKILRFDPFLLVLCASIRAMPPQPSKRF